MNPEVFGEWQGGFHTWKVSHMNSISWNLPGRVGQPRLHLYDPLTGPLADQFAVEVCILILYTHTGDGH